MNSIEAKKGFLTFFILTFLLVGIVFVGKKLYDSKFSLNTPKEEKILLVEPQENTSQQIENKNAIPGDLNGDGVINSLDFATPQPN